MQQESSKSSSGPTIFFFSANKDFEIGNVMSLPTREAPQGSGADAQNKSLCQEICAKHELFGSSNLPVPTI
jgi:hypothetical protein